MNTDLPLVFLIIGLSTWVVLALLDRYIKPWLAERMAKKAVADIEAGHTPPARKYGAEISFDADGIAVTSLEKRRAGRWSLKWSEVEEVVVFKRDYFTYDEICLSLRRVDGSGVELNEEMKGWLELTEALPRYLHGCKPLEDWIMAVAKPAFVENLTEIYSRQPKGINPAIQPIQLT